MGELVDRVKGALVLSEIVRTSGVELKRAGRRWQGLCPFHAERSASFSVDDERGSFKCFGCGKQGDVLTYLGLQLRTDDFLEILKRGCEIAGIDFEKETGGRRQECLRHHRKLGDILTAYVRVAQELWTPEKRAQARARKPYLNDRVIEAWGLGVAPTVSQCERANLTREELRMVGLLRVSGFQGSGFQGSEPDAAGPAAPQEYMHFRESIIIPHLKNGRCVYLADRALTDNRSKKILNMPLPDRDGVGGMAMPASFNLEALWDDAARERGVLLVEARLDAIACCEQGHPAVAFLSSPTPAFVSEIRKVSGVKLYYAPDGTDDMTGLKRAEAAGLLGWDVKCCRLPAGKDPDDLSGAELEQVKGAAVDCVEEWLQLVKDE